MLGYQPGSNKSHFHEQFSTLMDDTTELSAFETIVFMFDLIVNAEDRESTIVRFQQLMKFFD